jgi:hypothetical protein
VAGRQHSSRSTFALGHYVVEGANSPSSGLDRVDEISFSGAFVDTTRYSTLSIQ